MVLGFRLGVFVGSRTELGYISSDFKEVWITFIREFNRAFPNQLVSSEVMRVTIHSLQEKVTILKNEVMKKTRELGEDEKIKKCRESFIALISTLDSLEEGIRELREVIPAGEMQVEFKDIKKNRATLELDINKVKTSIGVAARAYVEVSRRGFLGRAIKVSAATVIALLAGGAGLSASLNYGLTYLARDLPLKKNEGLAVLISYGTHNREDRWMRDNAHLFIPMYVARIELAFGQKVNLLKRAATSDDFYRVMRDDTIQNVVVYGHGSWTSWEATDGVVNSTDLCGSPGSALFRDGKQIDEYFPQRKRGLLVRHTCGMGQEIKPEKGINLNTALWRILQVKVKQINQQMPKNLILVVEPVGFVWDDEPKFASSIYMNIEKAKNGKRIRLEELNGPEGNYSGDFDIGAWLYITESTDVLMIEQLEERMHGFFNEQPHLRSYFKELLDLLREVSKNRATYDAEKLPLLGTPVFKRENIKGWNRTSFPIDFMINVFGQEEKKLDQLYAMR